MMEFLYGSSCTIFVRLVVAYLATRVNGGAMRDRTADLNTARVSGTKIIPIRIQQLKPHLKIWQKRSLRTPNNSLWRIVEFGNRAGKDVAAAHGQ